MIIKPAQIDQSGIERLLQFAQAPEIMGLDHVSMVQQYVPGIFIPGVPLLDEPFNVPIIGDNESVSLTIDWPQKGELSLEKRVSYIGMLPAEEVTIGEPYIDDGSDNITSILGILSNAKSKAVDDAFDEFIGDWGGFLHAIVELRPSKIGTAEFILIETEDEFYKIHEFLETGEASVAELVSVIRLSKIAPQIGLRALVDWPNSRQPMRPEF